MNNEHPLLSRALRFPYLAVDLAPAGCIYDAAVGAWRFVNTGELWIEGSNRVGPRTKKQDIETGEDQKGE